MDVAARRRMEGGAADSMLIGTPRTKSVVSTQREERSGTTQGTWTRLAPEEALDRQAAIRWDAAASAAKSNSSGTCMLF
jgi:hypothetical protein